jgi:hypothetical protein
LDSNALRDARHACATRANSALASTRISSGLLREIEEEEEEEKEKGKEKENVKEFPNAKTMIDDIFGKGGKSKSMVLNGIQLKH